MVEHDHADDSDRARSQPLTASFCQFAVATGEPVVINDATTNALVRDLPGNRDGAVVAYAGIPLRTDAGHVPGTLCVADAETHDWRPEQLQLLTDLTVLGPPQRAMPPCLGPRSAVRRLELLQDAARDATPRRHLEAVRLRPGAHRLRVVVLAVT